MLVLVSVRESPGRNARLSPALAELLFFLLNQAIREVDFVGWYREGRVVGAVMPQPAKPRPDVPARILSRVQGVFDKHAVGRHLPLRVRTIVLGAKSEA
jgi:hypothetical protein